jgi:hypothetical protein
VSFTVYHQHPPELISSKKTRKCSLQKDYNQSMLAVATAVAGGAVRKLQMPKGGSEK